MRTIYEVTYLLRGKPAGFGGYFRTNEAARATCRTGREALPARIKRVICVDESEADRLTSDAGKER